MDWDDYAPTQPLDAQATWDQLDNQHQGVHVPDTPPADWGTYEPETAAGKPRWRFLSLTDLENLPRPKPLIANTFDQDALVLLAGYWGTYKSFVALDWAASIATGTTWNTREVLQQSVLYIAGEGLHGIKQRLKAWQHDRGVKIPDDAFHLMPDFFQLLDNGDLNELISYIKDRNYKFVVLDTLSRALGGNDENSNAIMASVIAAGDRIREATHGGTVMIVHHTGKNKDVVRGGVALEAGVDCVYMTSGGEGEVLLKRTKRKDGPLEDEHELEFLEVPGTGSGVLIPSDPTERKSSNAGSKLLGIFRDYFAATGATKNEFATFAQEQGLSKTSVYRGINGLLETGQLINAGSDARPRLHMP